MWNSKSVHLSYKVILEKWAKPGFLIIYFWSFQTNITTIFTANICENIQSVWDLNPWPLEHESPPISTRPGLWPQTNGRSSPSTSTIWVLRPIIGTSYAIPFSTAKLRHIVGHIGSWFTPVSIQANLSRSDCQVANDILP